jgi:hypothetical protein
MHFLPAIFQVNQPIHQKIKFQRNDQFPVRASQSAQIFKKSQFPVCASRSIIGYISRSDKIWAKKANSRFVVKTFKNVFNI